MCGAIALFSIGKWMPFTSRNIILGLLLLGAMNGRLALADEPATAQKSVAELVHDLQSREYGVRQAATLALMRLTPEHRSDMELALAHTSNEETIARLERVAVHLFMKAQTSFNGKIGLMGVRLSTEMVQVDPKNAAYQSCVVVYKTQLGFPAAEVLEPADRLIAVNGEKFPLNMSIDSFRKMINDAGGGAVIPFTLIRNGKVMDVKVRLAGLTDDINTLVQLVDGRERAAEEYRQSLKTGRRESLVAHDGAPAGNEKDRIDIFVPGGAR